MKRLSMRFALVQLRPDLADVGFKTIDQAVTVAERGRVGDQSVLPGPVTLTNGYEDILLDTGQVPAVSQNVPQLTGDAVQALSVPGRFELASGWSIESSVIDEVDLPAIQANPDPWRAYLSVNSDDEFILRPRISGEKMLPLGMAGHHVTIKEVMVNRKIPAGCRARWPVVATADGPLWLVGHLLDERGRVNEKSQKVVCLQVLPRESPESV
jgi:tRNA(Ile)-lysidine synthase